MLWPAHSANDHVGIQLYPDHVSGVYGGCRFRLDSIKPFMDIEQWIVLEYIVLTAAIYHDLGKLLPSSRDILLGLKTGRMINHCDAGVALLLKGNHQLPAWLVCAHHIGLGDKRIDLRDNSLISIRSPQLNLKGFVRDHIDKHLDQIEAIHQQQVDLKGPDRPNTKIKITPLLMRIALSILVDSDWADTARNYRNVVVEKSQPLRAGERFSKLDQYVENLAMVAKSSERNRLRNKLYEMCRNAAIQPFVECGALVGQGKTTSAMAYALRTGARRIFYVAPYNSILEQNIGILRDVLVLAGENPDDIFAPFYGSHEWKGWAKVLTETCNAPFVFTSNVQFFETLTSDHPRMLRKLHNFIGSCVLLDEWHSLEYSLMPLALENLKRLGDDFKCSVVFMSGSMVRPWTKPIITQRMNVSPPNVVNILETEFVEESLQQERLRIRTDHWYGGLTLKELCSRVTSDKYLGPKLAIFNTIKNSALVANELRNMGHDVVYLSTALTPYDRSEVIKKVCSKLKTGDNFFLVSTSCIECGVNLSFKFGFRELVGQQSHLQSGGRVNRSDEYTWGTLTIFELDMASDDGFTKNWDYELDKRTYKKLRRKANGCRIGPEDSDLHFEDVLQNGLKNRKSGDTSVSVDELMRSELAMQFEKVKKFSKVISSDKTTVLIRPELLEEDEICVSKINQHSVQIFTADIDKKLQGLVEDSDKIPGLKIWKGKYDPNFLGYYEEFIP